MATAKKLNESYQNFLESKDGTAGLETLLKVIREHVIEEIELKENKLKHLSEDLAQDVTIYVWQHRFEFQNKASFSTWLHHIIKSFILWTLRDEEEYVSLGTSYDLDLFIEEESARGVSDEK